MHPDTFLDRLSQNTHMWNLMKIRPVGAELFYADRQTDRRDESNNHFSQFCERAQKAFIFVCLSFRES